LANTIRIKRRTSGATGAPSSLANAELCFNEMDSTLYYGKGTGGSNGTATTVIAIGGDGVFATKTYVDSAVTGATPTGYALLSGASFTGNVTVGGTLTVNGTTETINATTVQVADKNIEIGKVASPTDTTADGGGITLKGATDKTLNWVSATSAWTSSEDLNLLTGKAFKINGTSVLSGTTLGTGVVNSSLTRVGTVTYGVWNADAVQPAYGGTGLTSAVTGLLKGNGTVYSVATAGTDYLSPSDTIDGGSY
jgi:hypothetical protein